MSIENVSILTFAAPTRKSTGYTALARRFVAAGETRAGVVWIEPPENATDCTDPPLPLPTWKSLL